MPILSTIGRRNWRVRLIASAMYLVLGVGTLSMIYPLMLMLSGSVKSSTDFYWISPIPRYLFDNQVLWAKYIESKYVLIPDAENAIEQPIGRWETLVGTPRFTDHQFHQAELFRRFRDAGTNWPTEWYRLGHMGTDVNALGQNARLFARDVYQQFHGDIVAYSDAMGIRYNSWSQITPPTTPIGQRVYTFPSNPAYRMVDRIKTQAPRADRWIVNLDALYWGMYLRNRWANVKQYNEAHDTQYADYQQVLLTSHPPESPKQRRDWEEFVRNDLNVIFIRINQSSRIAFQAFLRDSYENDIQRLNVAWGTQYNDFSEIPLQQRVQGPTRTFLDYAEFIADRRRCPLDALSIYGPRQAFEQYIAEQAKIAPDQVPHEALPIVAVDYLDFKQQTGALRWEFVKRNYLKVLDFILLHGNGVRNTVIYCGLMILLTLTINPLAAYALSRFKPPNTYVILLFCMCTMAFPPEVTMIPAFLLLKRFPVLGIFTAIIAALLTAYLLHKLFPRTNGALKGIVAGAAGMALGFVLLPWLIGTNTAYVSLLNTFWALILPGAANGFTIFMLKGFFDSLPRELYEAIDIDGGNEWHKFWLITMSLSKPILAVFALAAFTVAYSEYMMALVIIPDPKMWTLMVWLFQLQSQAQPYVVSASIVLAAIPTFLVFLFCQNLIMKGIVVPVEK